MSERGTAPQIAAGAAVSAGGGIATLTEHCAPPALPTVLLALGGPCRRGFPPSALPLLCPIYFSVRRTELQSQPFPPCGEGLLGRARLHPRSSLWQSNFEKFWLSAVSHLSFNLQPLSPALLLSLHPSQYLPRLWHGYPAVFAMVTTLPKALNLETGEDALTV